MDYQKLKTLMEDGGRTDEVFGIAAAVLGDILLGRRRLRAVQHPLGFLCLPVLRDGEEGACVHVFGLGGPGPGGGPAVAEVHAHSWELTSCVLYGVVGNHRMKVTEAADRPTHRVYEVRSSRSGVDDVRPTPRLVRCEPGSRQASGRGQIYRLPVGEFHTTRVSHGGRAATLVLGRSLPDRTDLSLGPLHGAGHRMTRRLCDTASTLHTVRAVLRRIDEAHRA